MKLSELFSREIFRPLMTYIIPGAAALAPWTAIVLHFVPKLRHFTTSNQTFTVVLGILLALAAGYVLEGLGAEIEDRWDKDKEKEQESTFEATWWKYLQLSFNVNDVPIGQHYLRDMLMALKFELGFCVACAVALPGTYVLGLLARSTGGGRWWLLVAVCAEILAVYGLLSQSRDSMKVLAELREKLVEQYWKAPA